MAVVEEQSMVPTVVVGVGGTGTEVLSRVRRLVAETYGSLTNFPIVSFLVVDTDKDYKVTNPAAAGPPLREREKYWARVGGEEVQDIVTKIENFPWIRSWLPNELKRNIVSLEAGAGQIRAAGRFAFFCNYHGIQKKFLDAVKRTKGHKDFMLDRYGIKVLTTQINVFVVASLSGGTGSGMLIDMGYCVRKWLQSEGSPTVIAIVPMPTAFAGISVGDRVLTNGYAAMMELSYFSDYRTEYVSQFSSGLIDEVRSRRPPFDFTYLVGTQNGESDFKLDQIRETIAQNIFLDLTSDFAPHKRSIRDNLKGAWAQADPGGRSYPKNFMSFGLSTIEIPIAQVRAYLTNQLSKDLCGWWLNESAILPQQMQEFVDAKILKRLRLRDTDLLSDLSGDNDRPYATVIAEWINSIYDEISQDNLLQCTQQGLNVRGGEQGKILHFVEGYLKPKVSAYLDDRFGDRSPHEVLQGDYLQDISLNRNRLIAQSLKALEGEVYRMLEDRDRGPTFAKAFIQAVRFILDEAAEKFQRDQGRVWEPIKIEQRRHYESILQSISESKDRFGVTKQAKMEEYCDHALKSLERFLLATIEYEVRTAGVKVIVRLQEHLNLLERRCNRLIQKLTQMCDFFEAESARQINIVNELEINGIQLDYTQPELNKLYQALIEQWENKETPYEIGMNGIASTLSKAVLQQTSVLWQEDSTIDKLMRLLDLAEIPDVQYEDVQEAIFNQAKDVVEQTVARDPIQQELVVCNRLLKRWNDDEILSNIRTTYYKSKPSLLLSRTTLSGEDAGFTPALNTTVAIVGGRDTANLAARRLMPKLQEFYKSDAIAPLGNRDRHRIIFLQELGGFSLRTISEMQKLRRLYQDWKGEYIAAKRAHSRGETRDTIIPLHITKDFLLFWDIFPEDPAIFAFSIPAKALQILRWEERQNSQERAVFYIRKTADGEEKVDIASNWDEVPQVLAIPSLRSDWEEIQQQVIQKLTGAETDAQKQELFLQLVSYLEELENLDGRDSMRYHYEARIVLHFIETYQLKRDDSVATAATPEPEEKMLASASSRTASGDKVLGHLERLAQLKQSGILTDDEFQTAKKRLLDL